MTRRLPPDDFEALDLAGGGLRADQLPAAQRRATRIAVARFDPGEVDRARAHGIVAFRRQESDIAEPALAAVIDRGKSGDVELAVVRGVDDLCRPGLFGHEQHLRAGDEGRGPGFGSCRVR